MTETSTNSLAADLRQSDAQSTIRAAYRQVFGNAHLMEEERCHTAESLFTNGDITVHGLVTAFAQSDTYRKLFFDKNGPYRFVELNFKHLLGRAPHSQAELSEHVQRLANEGYEAEINSYTFSDDYLDSFGLHDVPFMRGNSTQQGQSNVSYTRSVALDSGVAGFDGAKSSILATSIGTNSAPAAGPKTPGPGNRDSKRYTITWCTATPVGVHRRSIQRTFAPYSSLSSSIQSVQQRGGRILSITNT